MFSYRVEAACRAKRGKDHTCWATMVPVSFENHMLTDIANPKDTICWTQKHANCTRSFTWFSNSREGILLSIRDPVGDVLEKRP